MEVAYKLQQSVSGACLIIVSVHNCFISNVRIHILMLVALTLLVPIAVQADNLFDSLIKLARQGDAEAQLKVGEMYENGFGVEQDSREAKYWITRSANQNNETARFKLLYWDMLVKGLNDENKPKVEELMVKAKQGNAQAQYYLGKMYAHGAGLKKNYDIATGWLKKAALVGVIEAKLELASLMEEGATNRDYLRDVIQESVEHLTSSKESMSVLFRNTTTKFEQERNLVRSIAQNKRKPHSQLNTQMIHTFVKQIRKVNEQKIEFERMIQVEDELSLAQLYPKIIEADNKQDEDELRKLILQKQIIEKKADYLLKRNQTMSDLLISKYQQRHMMCLAIVNLYTLKRLVNHKKIKSKSRFLLYFNELLNSFHIQRCTLERCYMYSSCFLKIHAFVVAINQEVSILGGRHLKMDARTNFMFVNIEINSISQH